jgi:hypothetical protein
MSEPNLAPNSKPLRNRAHVWTKTVEITGVLAFAFGIIAAYAEHLAVETANAQLLDVKGQMRIQAANLATANTFLGELPAQLDGANRKLEIAASNSAKIMVILQKNGDNAAQQLKIALTATKFVEQPSSSQPRKSSVPITPTTQNQPLSNPPSLATQTVQSCNFGTFVFSVDGKQVVELGTPMNNPCPVRGSPSVNAHQL